ncbi:MAG: hypothetical protein JNL98_34185 [Bryobacterales bacterium]|nr:hypothetical protein [Bryobacterales bacterium]
MKRHSALWLLVPALLPLSMPGQTAPVAPSPALSQEKRAALLKAIDADIRQGKGPIEDEWLRAYMRSLAAAAGLPADFELVLLDHPQTQYLLLPGKLYVHSGGVLRAKSEEELRGELAHQFAHARLGHDMDLAAPGNPHLVWIGACARSGILIPKSVELRYQQREEDAVQTAPKIAAAIEPDPDGYAAMMARLAATAGSQRPFRKPTLRRAGAPQSKQQ